MASKSLHVNILIIIGVVTLSSCARILNSNQTSVSVITNTPVKLICKQDTIARLDTIHHLKLERSRGNLNVQLYNDSVRKSVNLSANVSPATYFNLGLGYLGIAGLLIDLHSPKGYGYPSKVYVNMFDPFTDYSNNIPRKHAQNHALKITPLKLIGFVNPSFEIAYEYRWNQQTSTQLMGGYITRHPPIFVNHPHAFDAAGFRIAVEQRYFIKQNAPEGAYIAVEFDLLKRQRSWSDNYDRFKEGDTIVDFTYTVNKRMEQLFLSGSAKIGWQFIQNRFLLDVYAGLGIRYAIVSIDGLTTDPKSESSNITRIFNVVNGENTGRFFTAAMPLNLRIGYLF